MKYIGYKIIKCPRCNMNFKIPIKNKEEDIFCPICQRIVDNSDVVKILDKPNDDYRFFSVKTEETFFDY